ncbi:hypothetical protein BK653_05035 [Pseudomonas brassicacearum]|nr:hypothetical protein BK653_05035 [Pseudomonas brassicacearum]
MRTYANICIKQIIVTIIIIHPIKIEMNELVDQFQFRGQRNSTRAHIMLCYVRVRMPYTQKH